MDFATLERVNASFVSDDLCRREDDIIWRARLGEDWCYAYLLLEFQSQPDPWMALRMLVYVGLLYQDLVKREALTREGRLPPVLPSCSIMEPGPGRGPWSWANSSRPPWVAWNVTVPISVTC